VRNKLTDVQSTSISIVAASRLVFAVARDGVLPFSSWISQVTSDGQPKHAVTVIYIFGASILCTILPSQVAFTSLVSAGAVPTIAAYGLISLLRLTMTPNNFPSSHFRLGIFAKPFYVASVLFNGLIFSVGLLAHLHRVLRAYYRQGYDFSLRFSCHCKVFQLCES
jgi:Amino acid transporters